MKMLWRRCKRNRAYAAVLAYYPVLSADMTLVSRRLSGGSRLF